MSVAICISASSAADLIIRHPRTTGAPLTTAAAGIAWINSIGNLGGFVAPTAFGFLEQSTGSIEGGLYGLAATSLVAAAVIFFVRMTPRNQSLASQPEACAAITPSRHNPLKTDPAGAAS